MHFTSNGYPASWIIPFDYNTAVRGDRRRGERPEGPFAYGEFHLRRLDHDVVPAAAAAR